MKRTMSGIMALLFVVSLLVAPVVAAEATEPVVPKEKVMLWNGADFAGWKLFLSDSAADVAKTWSIAQGVLRCEGRPRGYMRTETSYADYHLHVEWRWPGKPGNNGVLAHMTGADEVWPKSLECQLHSGNAGDFWVIGGVETAEHAKGGSRVKGRRTIKLKASSEKPLGQWNDYDIVCKDDWLVVMVNGVLQNVATKCSEKAGKICLQSEGALIEYRNIYVEPLE
jgi:3-keto-disaccharide hydrolase